MTEERVIEKLIELGCRSEQLDILVQDQKMQAANLINSAGMEKQVKYLLSRMDSEDLMATVLHEMRILQRYGMRCQSKLPEGNVRLARSRK